MDLSQNRPHNAGMNIPGKRVAVIDAVALTRGVMEYMPRFASWAAGKRTMSFPPVFPAVTCPAQSTYITGLPPEEHSCIGNGWYSRRMCEHQFWKQSNKLVQGPRIWEALRSRFGEGFTCAKLFWWYNMYSTADWTITPRPMYPADGRKVFDIYTQPMGLREEIKDDLGEFPFHTFLGPGSGIPATEWIARSAKWIEEKHSPHLSLVYLPYLDYPLQKFGPHARESITAMEKMDALLTDLIDFYEGRGIEVIVLSEYGISEVSEPVALNRIFRQKGWITVKPELGTDMLDMGASQAFAIADHQAAFIYVNDSSISEEVKQMLLDLPEVEDVVIPDKGKVPAEALDRIPDMIAVAREGAWFSYYYWEDDRKAPDFARCVDIHRKPGYDPAEMYIDEAISFPMLKTAFFLLKKKLGIRALLKLIPLHGRQIRGSHGRPDVPEKEQPVFISSASLPEVKRPEDVFSAILGAFDM